MINKLLSMILIFTIMLLVNGCTDVKKKDNFKIIESMKSPKSDISVFILKKRVLGGATVPYVYEFYFGKDINNINEKNIFLTLKGLNSYKIQWTSLNTIKLKIDASEILFFKSSIWDKKENIEYIVNQISIILK